MEGMAAAAIASLAGFVASVVLYMFVPFPGTGIDWKSPGTWLSVFLLVAGLSCFVVFLITGLITFFNRGSNPPPRERLHE